MIETLNVVKIQNQLGYSFEYDVLNPIQYGIQKRTYLYDLFQK